MEQVDRFLFSDLLSFPAEKHQEIILDRFLNEFEDSDYIKIATGYVSQASLIKLDQLLTNSNKKICLLLGMYYFDGFPESLYKLVTKLNDQWQSKSIGEIRVITKCKYHGKLYSFYRNNECIKAIIGSANLSFIPSDQEKSQQYEVAFVTNNSVGLQDVSQHLETLQLERMSKNLSDIPLSEIQLLQEGGGENNDLLVNTFGVELVTKEVLEKIKELAEKSKISFELPLKVPYEKDKHINSKANYTKSNLNVCYGIPREGEFEKSWYELQITVNKKIVRSRNYPKTKRKGWFYVVTDDGYKFRAHTTSQNRKQFSAVGDIKLLGKWIKGRLVRDGLIEPIKNVILDKERKGVITKEILRKYGRETLTFTKIGEYQVDHQGIMREIWFLSFQAKRD